MLSILSIITKIIVLTLNLFAVKTKQFFTTTPTPYSTWSGFSSPRFPIYNGFHRTSLCRTLTFLRLWCKIIKMSDNLIATTEILAWWSRMKLFQDSLIKKCVHCQTFLKYFCIKNFPTDIIILSLSSSTFYTNPEVRGFFGRSSWLPVLLLA